MEFIPLLLFLAVCLVLMCGFPVAFSLAGTSLAFAGIGMLTGTFDAAFLNAVPNRFYGIMININLFAVPMFVFMGMMLEKSKIAESLLEGMALLFGRMRGGLGLSVILVGMLLAASTGIVGATVVTMGILSLPTMLRAGYNPSLATGTICATGTLGQIIPPSLPWYCWGMSSPTPISRPSSTWVCSAPRTFQWATCLPVLWCRA